jgi:hypothetical protein
MLTGPWMMYRFNMLHEGEVTTEAKAKSSEHKEMNKLMLSVEVVAGCQSHTSTHINLIAFGEFRALAAHKSFTLLPLSRLCGFSYRSPPLHDGVCLEIIYDQERAVEILNIILYY